MNASPRQDYISAKSAHEEAQSAIEAFEAENPEPSADDEDAWDAWDCACEEFEASVSYHDKVAALVLAQQTLIESFRDALKKSSASHYGKCADLCFDSALGKMRPIDFKMRKKITEMALASSLV